MPGDLYGPSGPSGSGDVVPLLLQSLSALLDNLLVNTLNRITYTANSMLKADTAGTPVAFTVPPSMLVGRKATGGIGPISPAEAGVMLQTQLDVSSAAAVATHAGLADPHPGYLTPAEGGAAYDPLGAAATALGVANAAGTLAATANAVALAAAPKALWDANSVLKADVDDTPVVLPIAASRVLGRKATGGIVALTGAEVVSDILPSGTYAGVPVPGTPGIAALDVPQGVLSGRPASGTAGRLFYATDTKRVYRDNGAAWLPIAGRVNVLDFGADPTFTNDSVAAWQAAVTAAGTLALFTGLLTEVYAPAGKYKFVATSTAGGGVWHVYSTADNVIFTGDGDATEIVSAVDAHCFFLDGGSKVAGPLSWFSNKYVDATQYAIAPAAQYANTVTTVTPAQAGNFAAGDLIWVRTGSLLAGLVDYPDCETNIVESADAGTGVITLRRPLVKPYAQEYFVSGTSGVSATSVTANPALLAVAKVTNRTLRNVGVRRMKVTALSQAAGRVVVLSTAIVGLRVEDVTCEVSSGLVGGNTCLSPRITSNEIVKRGGGLIDYAIGFGIGAGDPFIFNNRIRNYNFSFIHIHEGVANPKVLFNTITLAATTPTTTQMPISFRARSYGAECYFNRVVNSTAGGAAGIYVDNTCVAGGRIAYNTIEGSNVATSVSLTGNGWQVTGTLGSGTVINAGTGNKLWNNANTADTFDQNINMAAGTSIVGATALQLLAASAQGIYLGAPADTNGLYVRRFLAMTDGKDFFLGSTTGTKLGTNSTQKLGFWGKAPIVQPSRAGALTDNSGGTGGGSTIAVIGAAVDPTAALKVDTANAIATLAARLNAIEAKLSAAAGGSGITA